MLVQALRIGVAGENALAKGIAFQVQGTPGMELAWLAGTDAGSLITETPIDVLVEATRSVDLGAELAMTALENQTHVVLTNPAVDLAVGPTLHALAYHHGLMVTSDAGTRHGVLATLIQEAEIMGFEIVQAGALAERDDPNLPLELAVLANSFGYLPPPGGMTGPTAAKLKAALTSFDFHAYGETPRIDFLSATGPERGLYLVVKPKPGFPAEQADYLRQYHLGAGPYYLLQRSYHLGHLETPKAILGAAAGQAILSPGNLTCDVYAYAGKNGAVIGKVEPLNDGKVPLVLIDEKTVFKTTFAEGQALTFGDLTLQDRPLIRTWIAQLG